MSKYRLPIFVAGVYAILFSVAMWFPLSDLANDPLSGLYAVLLGSPWSILTVLVLDGIDPNLLDSNWGLIGTGIGGFLNTVIIYMVLRRLFGASAEKRT